MLPDCMKQTRSIHTASFKKKYHLINLPTVFYGYGFHFYMVHWYF